MSSMIFHSSSGMLLKLDACAAERMRKHAQHERGQAEAGGVLLGRWLLNPRHYVVDDVSEPTQQDRRTRLSFFRSRNAHQQRIHATLQRSQQTCGYLGEWHTHPEPNPRPSTTDLGDWRRRLGEDRVDIPMVFFIIVGTTSIGAWMASRADTSKAIVRLELAPERHSGGGG